MAYRISLYISSVSFFILIAFSPYVALLLLLVLLIYTEVALGKHYYRYFIPIIIILLAFLASSRGIFETPKDDLSDYYKNFLTLSDGNYFAIFEWGFGLEVGLPIVSSVLSFIFPNAPPRVFLLYHFIIILTLFFYFLDKKYIEKSSSPALFIIFTCLFLGFTGIGNLLRQSYSSIFLLAALGFSGRKKSYFLILATLFHFSSLILYFLIRWYLNSNWKKIVITILGFSVFYFVFWMSILPVVQNYSYLKLTAYVSGEEKDSNILSILAVYKEIILVIILSASGYLFKVREYRAYLSASIMIIICAIMFEVIMPGISLRLNHAIIVFCIGPCLYYCLTMQSNKRISGSIFLILTPVLITLKVISFVNNPNDMALFDDGKIVYSEPFGYVDFFLEYIPNDKRNWKIMNYE